MNLSPHFSLEEFLRSETAARIGRTLQPEQHIIDNLQILCEEVLEPLREKLGRPITILSGWRPQWLNQMVGGAPTSEHVDGRAADLLVAGMTPLAVCRAIESTAVPFNQVIHEFGQWAHVSVAAIGSQPARKSLTAISERGRTVYIAALEPVDTTPEIKRSA